MYAILDAELLRHTNDGMASLLAAAGVPHAPVNDMARTFAHPQLLHRRMKIDLDHPEYGTTPTIGPAIKYSGFEITEGWRAPPLLGEGAEDALAEWLGAPADGQTRERLADGV
jgi:succinate--hydroxymethylglutarate CoA-transferase